MPELPEVETMKLQLAKYLVGHKILSVEVKNRRTFQGDETKILDAKILDIRRFGKVSVIDLSNGYSILTHVKLTGQYIYRGPNLSCKVGSGSARKNPPLSSKVIGGLGGPHTLVIFNLDRDGVLYYNDVRRFGWIRIEKTEDVEKEKFIVKLGPEPHVTEGFAGQALTLDLFRQVLSKTSRPVKLVLMDQTKMGGVGNIYANDALWLAKINPKIPSKELQNDKVTDLYKAIFSVLKEGLKYGGASELAFVTPDGREGEYQNHTLVYGREGEPCERCHKSMIQKFFLSGRGTYFCPVCQK
jgi:formamidopyrimidine-DNA glycosylase